MTMHSAPRDERLRQVLELSSVDADFRQRLLATPHQAIRDAFGIHVPDHFRMRFIERDRDTDALVVLPDLARPGGELDEDDLDGVSGGSGGFGDDW